MPFGCMYVFSDFNAFILRHIIRYRRKVVINNLHKAFPEKDEKTLRRYERSFYSYFTDMLLEAGKGYRMTRKKLDKRYRFQNPELLDNYYNEGKSVILLMAHINNWEWITGTMGERFNQKMFAIYKPLTNKRVDAFIRKSREHRNFQVVPLKSTGLMFRNMNSGPCAFVMAADQSPIALDKAHWVTFLHQTTGFLHGPETYAKKFGTSLVFMKVIMRKRGYYDIVFQTICDDPKTSPEGHITARYAQLLEELIKEQPTRWLWSHKRWKRNKPEDKKLINLN